MYKYSVFMNKYVSICKKDIKKYVYIVVYKIYLLSLLVK